MLIPFHIVLGARQAATFPATATIGILADASLWLCKLLLHVARLWLQKTQIG